MESIYFVDCFLPLFSLCHNSCAHTLIKKSSRPNKKVEISSLDTVELLAVVQRKLIFQLCTLENIYIFQHVQQHLEIVGTLMEIG